MTDAAANPAPVATDQTPNPAPTPVNTNQQQTPQETKTPAPAATVLDDKKDPDNLAPAPQTWPDDWRAKIAGDDKATLDRLSKMASPADVWKSYRALEAKFSERGVKTSLPENPTPEDLARWRKDNGIPQSPNDYDLTLPDGMIIGDSDKENVMGFVKAMHEKHTPPEVVKTALSWYFKAQDDVNLKMDQADSELKKATEDSLRADWGKEYRANINTIADFLIGRFGQKLGAVIHTARTEDGSILGNNPEFLNSILGLAREVDPGGTLVPGATNHIGAIDDEIGQINKLMRENPREYYNNPKYAERLAALLGAQAKLKSRAA